MTKYNESVYNMMLDSFNESVGEDQETLCKFLIPFSRAARSLSVLPIQEVLVDVSTGRPLIDFDIVLPLNIMLSVRLNRYDGSDDVQYSISRNHDVIDVGVMGLDNLIDGILKQFQFLC